MRGIEFVNRPKPRARLALAGSLGLLVFASAQCTSLSDPGADRLLSAAADSARPPGFSATKAFGAPQEWTPVSSPATARLMDVWSAGNAVFAVGENGTIVRSRGRAFVQMPTPTSENLAAVWGTTPGSVFAVGFGPTVLRLEGGDWIEEVVATPGPAEAATDIWGASRTDVYLTTSGPEGGRIRHSDEGWPTVAQFSSSVTAIHGFASNDIYALVTDFRFSQLAHYDGSNWLLSPITTGHALTLSSIWGTAGNDLFAAGFDHDTGMGTVAHFDGATWSLMEVPPNPQTPLRDLWGTSSRDVFALASPGVLFHYDGTTWSTINTGIESGDLEGIYGTGTGDVFFVGTNGLIARGRR